MNYNTISILAAMLVSQSAAAASAPCQTYVAAYTAGAQSQATKDAYGKLVAADVNPACVAAIINMVGGGPAAVAQQVNYFNSNSKILTYAAQQGVPITDISHDVFGKLKPEVFNTFLKKHREAQCSAMTHPYLTMAVSSKKRAAEITPDCFAAILNLQNHAIVEGHVKNLPDKVFLEVEDILHPNYYKGMTGVQLKNYQAAKYFDDNGDRCVDMPLQHIKPKILGEIAPACLQNWLANFVATGPNTTPQLTFEQMKAIEAKHFSNAEYDAFGNLRAVFAPHGTNGKSAWVNAKKDFVQLIADHEFWSHNLPAEAVHKDLKVTARAFANMNPEAQGAVLERVSDLPDDLFAHCTETSIRAIVYDDDKNEKKKCHGFSCLKKLESHKNVAKIMEHIDETVCFGKKFDSFVKIGNDAPNDYYLAGKYMSRTCFKNLDVDATQVETSGNSVHENMLKYVSIDTIKEIWLHKDGSRWLELAESYAEDKKKNRVWPGLLQNPKVCARLVDIQGFHKLAKEGLTKAMDGFSSECLRVLPDFEKLTSEYVAAIGDQIYSAFTKSEASKIDFSKSSHAQLANASSRVENIADHYATTLTAASVKTIPDAVFAMMNEGYFIAMTEDAYSGITKEQFGQAPCDKITKVTAAQFSKMSDDVKKSLSPEQITAIGSHAGPKSEPEMAMLKALGAVSGSFNEAQSKAYKARVAESSGAIGAAGTSLMVLAASLALVFPLL